MGAISANAGKGVKHRRHRQIVRAMRPSCGGQVAPRTVRYPFAFQQSTRSRNGTMSLQIIKRRSRGFICVNAHPEGCRRNVEEQIAVAQQATRATTSASERAGAPRNVLVIGASTGYGLASRIAAAWGYGA